MDGLSQRFVHFVGELKRRRVFRSLLAYGAGAFAVLQVADVVFAVLLLPDLALSLLALGFLAGIPIVAVLAWIYEMTTEGLRRDEHAPADPHPRRMPMRRYLELIGAFTVAAVLVVITAGAISRIRYPASDNGRVGLAIFPFRTLGITGSEWSEGAADLLATALEGTPSLRVVDPWPLWRPLRPEPTAPPLPPEVDEAADLAREFGAHRFLLGSAVTAGDRVEVSLRLYQVGRAEPVEVLSLDAGADELGSLAEEAAVRVLSRVWGPLRPANLPAELDFDATQSPEALKAFLAAKEAMRRGGIDSANTAIDRALELDSAFVLAMVEATIIKSWGLAARGQPFSGLFEILARAEPYEDRLNERTRLRLRSSRASIRTDGPTAIAASRRILELDPLDYSATAALAYYDRVYGWQLAPPDFGDGELSERLVQLDSTQVTGLAARAVLALARRDTADLRLQLERLLRADTTSSLAHAEIMGLRAVLGDDDEFDRLLPAIVSSPLSEQVPVVRSLRQTSVRRHERYIDALAAHSDPRMRQVATGEGIRWNVARGWTDRVHSAIESGAYDHNQYGYAARRFLVASDLSGMGDPVVALSAVDDLAAYVPVDSARILFDTRPVWWTGWLVGAWHGQKGDTSTARRWIDAIGTLPPGGTSEDYVGSLRSDIEARLATRAGRVGEALDLARDAFRLWTIHTENTSEALPEPAMRLNLALLYKASAMPDSARALLSSLVPPTTWLGFLTARASYELGVLEAERGQHQWARFHFGRARHLWADGGPATREWLQRVDDRLGSLPSP
jgi:hypothetical protein